MLCEQVTAENDEGFLNTEQINTLPYKQLQITGRAVFLNRWSPPHAILGLIST